MRFRDIQEFPRCGVAPVETSGNMGVMVASTRNSWEIDAGSMATSTSLITAGETVLFSAGEYPDYGIHDLGVALVTFDLHEALKAYLIEYPEQREDDFRQQEDYDFRPSKFLAYLVLKQFMRTIAYREAFLGAHNTTSNIEMRNQVGIDHGWNWDYE